MANTLNGDAVSPPGRPYPKIWMYPGGRYLCEAHQRKGEVPTAFSILQIQGPERSYYICAECMIREILPLQGGTL